MLKRVRKRRATEETIRILCVLLIALGVMLVSPCAVQAQPVRKPLSVEEIEYLLQQGVTVRRVASLVEEQGVKFEVTEAVKERVT